jgi:hypothetical protein
MAALVLASEVTAPAGKNFDMRPGQRGHPGSAHRDAPERIALRDNEAECAVLVERLHRPNRFMAAVRRGNWQ